MEITLGGVPGSVIDISTGEDKGEYVHPNGMRTIDGFNVSLFLMAQS